MFQRRLPSGRLLAALGAAVFLMVHPGGTGAMAAQLSPQQVSQFMANPSAILKANPNGGRKLAAEIRDLLLSDPATLNTIMSLLRDANDAQQAAIGSGAGQAAQASVRLNPAFAAAIQKALADSGSQTAIASYAAATGNVEIGSSGDAGGGSGGPVNGGPPTGGGGGGGGGLSGSAGSSSGGGGLTGGGGVSGGGGSSTLASSVSPQ
jgi:hypothetical protein